MKLKDNLFSIIGRSPEAAAYRIALDPECAIYKAHFPERAVTPGVCIIQIAKELFEDMIDSPLALTEVVNAKFLQVIEPALTPQLTYAFPKVSEPEPGFVKVAVTVSDADTVYAKASLIFRK